MKYDFTSILERKGHDALAVDALGERGYPGLPEEGWAVIPMWVADMNFPVPPVIQEHLNRRISHPAFGYFEPSEEYYSAIVNWQEKRNRAEGLTKEQIGYENGVLGGLMSALAVICVPGDRILVHEPTYIGFRHSLSNAGYRLVPSPLVRDGDGVWRMDFEDMERKLREKNIHAMIFCSPQNPSGRVWTAEEMERMMDLCRRYDVYVVSDEIWSDLVLTHSPVPHTPLQSVSEEARQRTIALYAPSKTFNLAGLVGSYHIIRNPRLKAQVDRASSLSHYNSMNVLSMHALIGAYSEEGEEWLEELRQVLSRNVLYAVERIRSEWEGVSLFCPEGTYMLFPDCGGWCRKKGITMEELLDAGWKKGVAWQDGRPFGGTHTVRINLALPYSRVEEAFDRLKKYVFTGGNRKMNTIVAKFGGTSLADAEQFRKIKRIVEEGPGRRILVASAPGKRFPEDTKVTDLLLDCWEKAYAGQPFEAVLQEIRGRFQKILEGLGMDFPLDEEIETIREHLGGKPEKDYMASRGEYLNSRILAEFLGYTFVDPAWCVCFTESGELDQTMTRRAMGAALRPLKKAVIAGFYGADSEGVIHTFSRGGSDVTGSLAACAIQADLYENWTDVSGLLAADPRIVDAPHTVEYLTYRELRTLSYMGASVLHTDAVLPASDMGIPINIRNTNRPEDPGTMIVRKLPSGKTKHPVTGVAGRKGMSVIQVEKVMVSDGSGFSAIMLDILKKRRLPFEQCLTGIDTITLVIKSDLLVECREDLFREIREELNPDYLGLKENLSMIAVTGEKGTESSDANVQVLQALTAAGIEISTVNQGAGKLNLLIGVPEERYEDAIRAIYRMMQDG